MKKRIYDMISFTSDNEEFIFIVGGTCKGSPTATPQPDATYIARDNGIVVTNEQHMYNLSTSELTNIL